MNVLNSLTSDRAVFVKRLSIAIDLDNSEVTKTLLDNLIKINKIIKEINPLEGYDE